MLSDSLGMAVTSLEMPQVLSLGTAMCGAVGFGTCYDLEHATEAMRPISRIVEPDPQRAQEYAQCYGRRLSTAKRLEGLSGTWGEHVEL